MDTTCTPKGIRVKTLFNNNGIRFGEAQMVVPPKWQGDWYVQDRARRGIVVDVPDVYPSHYYYGCYRFTPEQYAWVGIKCATCEKNNAN